MRLSKGILHKKEENSNKDVTYQGEEYVKLEAGFNTQTNTQFLAHTLPLGPMNVRYNYVLRDHLGNSRVIFSDIDNNGYVGSNEIVSEHHYYPFGLEMSGSWQNNNENKYDYLYNGKEIQRELGLGYYDFGFRFYDPAIARFTGVDPISDQFPHVSTYNYAENSPIANIDLWGLQAVNFQNKDVGNMQSYFKENARNRNLGRGDDCMTCHIKGIEILTNRTIPKGNNSDGKNNINRQRKAMQDEGLAKETLKVAFDDSQGRTAVKAGDAETMQSSVGDLAAEKSKGTENSVFGVSMGDGYHTMTLTVTNTPIFGPVDPDDDPLVHTTFTLSDQGPGSAGYGNMNFSTSSELDARLSMYLLNSVPEAYPATIEIHQIINPDE